MPEANIITENNKKLNINILSWNIRSIKTNSNKLLAITNSEHFDIVLLQKTCIQKKDFHALNNMFNDYKILAFVSKMPAC